MKIVDGSGFLFRARFAFPAMPNAQWQNLNVVYGFTRMLLKLIDENLEYFVIAWDSPTKTKRHEAYPDYKGTRPKLDDDFKQQIPLVKQLVEDLGIPSYVAPGYEADDIIASLAKKYQKSDLLIEVVSSDKDLKQLLSDTIIVTDPAKNISTKTSDFLQEFGFAPELIVDYLALIGDSADNIKGVSGIGPKGALDLVQRYGNLDSIYQHIDQLSPKLREKLQSGKEDAYFSKSLIELIQVPELDFPLEKRRLKPDFWLRESLIVNKYGFLSIQKLLDELRKKREKPQQLWLF